MSRLDDHGGGCGVNRMVVPFDQATMGWAMIQSESMV